MSATVVEGLRGKLPVAVYCSPQPAAEVDGRQYPGKITQTQYRRMRDAGVNLVYGHNEVFGTGTEFEAVRALALAADNGMAYFVKDAVFREYLSRGYAALGDADKLELDRRLERSLWKYRDCPAFAGVAFADEPGSDAFPAIARAKKVFDENARGVFYVNLYPYYASASQLQYGANEPASDIAEYRTDRPNAERYEAYLDRFVETVKPQVFSYDAYPFVTFGPAHTAVHAVLYEMQQLGRRVGRKYGVPYWPFLQAGGLWEGTTHVRVPTFAEMNLQVNVALALGAKGLQLFPYCFPNDWLSDRVQRSGLIDANGEETELYGFAKYALKRASAAGAALLEAESAGVVTGGTFRGLLPDERRLKKIRWNECIYRGVLPPYANPELESWRELKRVSATGRCLVGCYDRSGESLFYLVNDSTVCAADATLEWARPCAWEVADGGVISRGSGDKLAVRALPAGEARLIRIINQGEKK